MPHAPVLAIDLGGSKLAAALIDGTAILARREVRTERDGGAAAWLQAIAGLCAGWTYGAAGAAVTGLVRDGLWQALNPDTLPVPLGFPLLDALRRELGVPVLARNDAQAAAWGEFRFGAGQGTRDMVFVTVSTGIGGGIVHHGRLVEGRMGLAGHVGIAPVETMDGIRRLEDIASGRALERLAAGRGGAAITRAARDGDAEALALLDVVIAPLALALRRLQLELDPEVVVIGGGLGLAPGYLDRLRHHLAPLPTLTRSDLRAAALGADAGLVGIADLAATEFKEGRS